MQHEKNIEPTYHMNSDGLDEFFKYISIDQSGNISSVMPRLRKTDQFTGYGLHIDKIQGDTFSFSGHGIKYNNQPLGHAALPWNVVQHHNGQAFTVEHYLLEGPDNTVYQLSELVELNGTVHHSIPKPTGSYAIQVATWGNDVKLEQKRQTQDFLTARGWDIEEDDLDGHETNPNLKFFKSYHDYKEFKSAPFPTVKPITTHSLPTSTPAAASPAPAQPAFNPQFSNTNSTDGIPTISRAVSIISTALQYLDQAEKLDETLPTYHEYRVFYSGVVEQLLVGNDTLKEGFFTYNSVVAEGFEKETKEALKRLVKKKALKEKDGKYKVIGRFAHSAVTIKKKLEHVKDEDLAELVSLHDDVKAGIPHIPFAQAKTPAPDPVTELTVTTISPPEQAVTPEAPSDVTEPVENSQASLLAAELAKLPLEPISKKRRKLNGMEKMLLKAFKAQSEHGFFTVKDLKEPDGSEEDNTLSSLYTYKSLLVKSGHFEHYKDDRSFRVVKTFENNENDLKRYYEELLATEKPAHTVLDNTDDKTDILNVETSTEPLGNIEQAQPISETEPVGKQDSSTHEVTGQIEYSAQIKPFPTDKVDPTSRLEARRYKGQYSLEEQVLAAAVYFESLGITHYTNSDISQLIRKKDYDVNISTTAKTLADLQFLKETRTGGKTRLKSIDALPGDYLPETYYDCLKGFAGLQDMALIFPGETVPDNLKTDGHSSTISTDQVTDEAPTSSPSVPVVKVPAFPEDLVDRNMTYKFGRKLGQLSLAENILSGAIYLSAQGKPYTGINITKLIDGPDAVSRPDHIKVITALEKNGILEFETFQKKYRRINLLKVPGTFPPESYEESIKTFKGLKDIKLQFPGDVHENDISLKDKIDEVTNNVAEEQDSVDIDLTIKATENISSHETQSGDTKPETHLTTTSNVQSSLNLYEWFDENKAYTCIQASPLQEKALNEVIDCQTDVFRISRHEDQAFMQLHRNGPIIPGGTNNTITVDFVGTGCSMLLTVFKDNFSDPSPLKVTFIKTVDYSIKDEQASSNLQTFNSMMQNIMTGAHEGSTIGPSNLGLAFFAQQSAQTAIKNQNNEQLRNILSPITNNLA